MNGGYFKIAMYPYNRKSQFTKIVELMTPQGQHIRLGGVLAFTVSNPPVLKKLPVNKQPPNPNSLSKSLDYYKNDEDDIVLNYQTLFHHLMVKNQLLKPIIGISML